jgi:hypothetical protein
VPYVSLLTANNSVVYCFPTPEHVGDFDTLEKGKSANFVGTFFSFNRGENDQLRITLGDCRLAN